MNELKFDLVLHLAGEQVIPNYMGIRSCECPQHILAVTSQTSKQKERLVRELGLDEGALSVLSVPAYDYPEILRVLDERVAGLTDKRIGFNITGGTKPMSTAALDVCRKYGFQPFYVETQTKKIHLFVAPYLEVPLQPFFSSPRQFIGLTDETIGEPGKVYEEAIDMARFRLINDFWKNRNAVRAGMEDFAAASSNRFRGQKKPPEEFWRGHDQLMGWATRAAPGLAEHWSAVFPDDRNWRAAADFGRGGWFEEYVLMSLHDAGGFFDVRMGMTVSISDTYKNEKTVQELDISYSTGHELVIIECKAGQIKQEHLQKLENLSRRLGGSFGRGVLIAINPPDDVIRARIASSRLSMICGAACNQLAKRLADMAPGWVYET